MLEVEVAGMKLRNPVMLASGILGSKHSSLLRIAEFAGAVVSKSVGVERREGYRNPAVLNRKCCIVNAVGLASPGAEVFSGELREFSMKSKTPLVVSLFASRPDEFASLADYFPFASAFELNLSCPHAENAGMALGVDEKLVKKCVQVIKDVTDKPVFAKLTPNVTDIVDIGRAAEEGGADAVVAVNTVKAMAVDIFSRKPVLSNIRGGMSGKALKGIALRCVWDLYEELEIPVIGCGGISSWKDALEFILAGASAVQVGSAFYYSYRAIEGIVRGLKEYLRLTGEKIKDLIGAAHENA